MHQYIRLALLATASLLAVAFVGNQDLADSIITEAIEKEARPARVMYLNCDCPKLNSGREWLRFQIAHKPDSKGCTIFCQYGKPQLIAENL